ncbi:MAG: c-type cytochrome domain-containing protein [Flavobacteriales bacterium]|nr:c-type cytochrome domain-containing protein [Flavobacteriales bacterium]
MKLRLVLSFLSIITIASCRHQPDDIVLPPDGNGIVNGDPCDPDSVYFANIILPLLVSNCALPDCHDAINPEEDVNLTTYNFIMSAENGEFVIPGDPWASKLMEVITETDLDKLMPPDTSDLGPLSNDEIAAIETWILQGALNNSCTADCDTTNVTFAAWIAPLISNYCEGCHSGNTPSGTLSLTNYDEIKAAALDSSMLHSLMGTGGYEPMPYQSEPLSECQIDMIEIWINDGAPNN